MKKIFFIISFVTSLQTTYACDVCGGAVVNTGGDVIPGIFSNFVGVNASFRSFNSSHLTLFENEVPITSKELFSLYSIHGRYSPVRRLQFLFNVPVSFVRKEMEGERKYATGLSDVSMRVNYLLIDRNNDSTETFFNLFSGATLKAPTGRSQFFDGEEFYFHRNMLPGSGTTDFGFHLDLLYRKKNYGFTFNGSSLLRGKIQNSYDFGNVYNTRISGFRFFDIKQSKLMLDLGMELSVNGQDRNLYSNASDRYTGGWMLSPSLRLNYFWKELVFNVTAQRPVHQNLAEGQVKNNYALQGSVIYLIGN
ncbi:MAG: hypothetical protein ACFHU9_00385 [Fluviicola sp.]